MTIHPGEVTYETTGVKDGVIGAVFEMDAGKKQLILKSGFGGLLKLEFTAPAEGHTFDGKFYGVGFYTTK